MSTLDADVRAMLLAAGFGTRLRPLTERLPKPLVRVHDVPLIDIALEHLLAAGIRRVAINLHHRALELRRAIEPSAALRGLTAELYEEHTILGTGGGLRNAYPTLRDADAVVLMNADTLTGVDLASMLRDHLESGAAATLLLRPNPDPVAYASVLTDANLRVRRIAGLPATDPSVDLDAWMFAGVHILSSRVIELLPFGPSDVNRALHPQLISGGELVRGYLLDGSWWDIGTPERLLAANLEALDASPAALTSAVTRAGIGHEENLILAPTARLEGGACATHSVVGHGSVIGNDAQVERSVVLPRAQIGRGANVTDSIIGPDTSVAANTRVENSMLVGSQCVPIRPRADS